jgi:soluble lytic murein transglycosylase
VRKVFIFAVIAVVIVGALFYGVFGVLYPLRYKSEIIKYAGLNNLPPALVASLINAESGFEHTKVSSKGAVGLMQIMPTTASYVAQKYAMSAVTPNLFDAEENIALGTKYLAYLTERFGDTATALFAYNAGEGKVAGWLAENNMTTLTECPYPETNAYVAKVLRGMNFYKLRFI